MRSFVRLHNVYKNWCVQNTLSEKRKKTTKKKSKSYIVINDCSTRVKNVEREFPIQNEMSTNFLHWNVGSL